MNIYIDANVYLAFIEPHGEKLSSLSVLRQSLEKGSINLIFPQITYEEVTRNLQRIKNDSVAALDQYVPGKPSMAPSIRKSNRDNKFQKLVDDYQLEIDELKAAYLKSADKLIDEEINVLYKNSKSFKTSDDLFQNAHRRRLLGNPPGKGKNFPIGDELAWEIILKYYHDENLVVIANDSDWKEYNPNTKKEEIKYFLKTEWENYSKAKITLYTSLGEFLNKKIKPPKPIEKKEIEQEKSISYPYNPLNRYVVSPSTAARFSPGTYAVAQPISGISNLEALNKLLYGGQTAYEFPSRCPNCLLEVDQQDKFCRNCGAKQAWAGNT